MSSKYLSLLLLLVFMLTGGCAYTIAPPTPSVSTNPTAEPTAMPEVQLNPNGVIFTPAQTEVNFREIGGDITGTWIPTAEAVAQLEAALPAFLQQAENDWLRPDPPIWERVPTYQRQYLGIVEAGNEVIYANFFCSAFDDTWDKELVVVMDGGDCYFQLKYNPTTGEFYDFSVNGEA